MLGTKTSPIICVLGFNAGILLSLWWLWGSILKFLYQCCTTPTNTIWTCCYTNHTNPSLLLIFGTWSYPLWQCLPNLLNPVISYRCWPFLYIFVIRIYSPLPFVSVNFPFCIVEGELEYTSIGVIYSLLQWSTIPPTPTKLLSILGTIYQGGCRRFYLFLPLVDTIKGCC